MTKAFNTKFKRKSLKTSIQSNKETNPSQLNPIKITDFSNKVYNACKRIPRGFHSISINITDFIAILLGKVTTYAILAKSIDNVKGVRAVGNSLRRNPFAPEVPCHRVIASDLKLGLSYIYIL